MVWLQFTFPVNTPLHKSYRLVQLQIILVVSWLKCSLPVFTSAETGLSTWNVPSVEPDGSFRCLSNASSSVKLFWCIPQVPSMMLLTPGFQHRMYLHEDVTPGHALFQVKHVHVNSPLNYTLSQGTAWILWMSQFTTLPGVGPYVSDTLSLMLVYLHDQNCGSVYSCF